MNSQFLIPEQTLKKLLYITIAFELILLAGFLVISFIGSPGGYAYTLLNLGGEKNLPALFSSLQLLLVGIVFLNIALLAGQTKALSPLFMILLGLGFIYLAFDEFLSLHEGVTRAFVHNKNMPRFKGDHGLWVAPYLFVGLLFFVLNYREFLKMWKTFNSQTRIMAAGIAIFLLGAVGMEVIGYQFLMDEDSPRYLYKLEVATEEFLEMLGISIALYGTLLLRQAVIRNAL